MHRYRSATFPLPLLLLLALFFLAGCGGDQSNTPNAQDLLNNASTAVQKLKFYHFTLNAENPGAGGLYAIKAATGDVSTPDKLQARATALTFGTSVEVQMVAISEKQYLTDPISQQWSQTNGLLDPRVLSDPNTGVAAMLKNIQNPSEPKSSNVDGNDCWGTSGKLDAKYIASIASSGGGKTSNTAVDTTVCIGKTNNLPYLIRMNGVAIEGDTAKTVRTFKLSKFDEPVTIVAPI